MAINNGEAHPGDPSQVGSTSQPTGGGNPPADDTKTQTPPATITEVTPTSVSEGVQSIPTEISVSQNTPVTANGNPNDGTVSFDIGGDVGFDIGGIDIGGVAESTGTSTSSDSSVSAPGDLGFTTSMNPTGSVGTLNTLSGTVSEVPSQSASDVPFIVGEATPVTSTETVINIENIIPQSMPVVSLEEEKAGESLIITTEAPASATEKTPNPAPTEILASSIPSTESPLMNLMGGFTQGSEAPTPTDTNTNSPTMPTSPVTDSTITPVSESTPADALFSLIGDAPEEKTQDTAAVNTTPEERSAPVSTLEVSETTSNPLSAITEEISSEAPLNTSSIISPVVEEMHDSGEHPMSEVGKELARMTRSPRLQGKLLGFISGLEELSKEEEVVKAEKRKQIESYQLRITELKAEYETRIHALELEEADLKKQIAQMDEEREHLTQVIDGFKKELEVV